MESKNTEPTDEFLKELGISRLLYNQWDILMKVVLQELRMRFMKRVKYKEGDGFIKVDGILIEAHFMNSKFIQLTASKGEIELMSVRSLSNPWVISSLLITLISTTANNPLLKKPSNAKGK